MPSPESEWPAIDGTGDDLSIAGARVAHDFDLHLAAEALDDPVTVDLYSAVRNAYLQRRQRAIDEALDRSPLGCRPNNEPRQDSVRPQEDFARSQEEQQSP